MDSMKRAWRGEEKLWKVFWLYGTVAGIVLGGLRFVAILFVPAASMPLLVVRLLYSVWLYIATWRCAFNADWRGWGYIVRILVVLGVIGTIAGLGVEYYLATSSNDLARAISKNALDPDTVIRMQMQMSKNGHISAADLTAAPPTAAAPSAIVPAAAPPVATPVAAPAAAVETLSPPSASTPVAPLVAVNPDGKKLTDKFKAQCEKTMTDYAVQNKADPQQYIQQNQAYMQQCVEYYMKLNSAATAAPANPGR